MPFIPLALCLFFQKSNFYSNVYLSIYVCFFKVNQLFPKQSFLTSSDNDVTQASILPQSMLDPRYFTPPKWRVASVFCYWEFVGDFSVFIMITMDGYKGRQIACLFMTWLSYASTYLLRKPLGVVSIRALLSDVTWHALKCITWILWIMPSLQKRNLCLTFLIF